ncbi:MAG TPA: SprT family zinc-dependent metalloprotease [Alphaproteobacteria bacterium]|nr:SprT family zinc-dependent metalloprotease [Alphaproteobacteria bacterium]
MTRKSPRARRISLRIAPAEDKVELVLPRGASLGEGLRFAEEKSGWLLTQLAVRPPRVPFAPGAVVPYRGVDHLIHHRPEARGGVWREDGVICVSGASEFLSRRVKDWLKREALALLSERAQATAARLNRRVARVSLRDTTSRWGSCSTNGVIHFSWRLVLAPDWVLDYVVAHEIAHLVHPNHGQRFWRLVATLTPEVNAPRDWLRRQGEHLLRYG